MNIRPVEPEDAASTAKLLNAIIATGTETSMSDPLTPQEQLLYITSFPPRGVFLVAELPAPYGIVGMQSIEPCGERGGPTGHVAEISTFVAAAYRGRGVASALLRELSGRASANGIRKLSATIRADNQSAQSFYLSKAGFKLVGTMGNHLLYRGQYIDQVLAERLLSSNVLELTGDLTVIDTWTDSEKKIARRVFEAALAAEISEVISQVRARASRVQVPEDAWALEEFLRTRRIEIDQKYEYRYSQLVMLFGRLLLEGRIHDTDLDGLSDEKCRKIRLVEAFARS